MTFDSLMILGTTATGKTKLAAHLANEYNGEIISADSRQVYRKLNIGSGKDYDEYTINGNSISYHLIDVAEIDNVFYLKDFVSQSKTAFQNISLRNNLPIICGGTGLYLDSLLKDYSRMFIPENELLRIKLYKFSTEELLTIVTSYTNFREYNFDLKSRKRVIRAIEILEVEKENSIDITQEKTPFNPLIIGLYADVDVRKKRITHRLNERFKNGLIEEVEQLLKEGYTKEQLLFLGLEYKFITQYLVGEKNMDEMKLQLEIAIHQYAKRQATWFRKMEREGFQINWIEVDDSFEHCLEKAKSIVAAKF